MAPAGIDSDSQMYGQALEWLANFRDCWTVKVDTKNEQFIEFKTQDNARAFVAAFMYPDPMILKKKDSFNKCFKKHGPRIIHDLRLLENAPDKQAVINNIWATAIAFNYQLFDVICGRITERANNGEKSFKEFILDFGIQTFKVKSKILQLTVPSDLANTAGVQAVQRLLTLALQKDLYVQYVVHKLRGGERPLPPQYKPLPKQVLVEAVGCSQKSRSSKMNTFRSSKAETDETNIMHNAKYVQMLDTSMNEECSSVQHTLDCNKRISVESNSSRSIKAKLNVTNVEQKQTSDTSDEESATEVAVRYFKRRKSENISSPRNKKAKTDETNIIQSAKNIDTTVALDEELSIGKQILSLFKQKASKDFNKRQSNDSNSFRNIKDKTNVTNIEQIKKNITLLQTPYITVEELLKALQEIILICDSAVELGPKSLKLQMRIIKKVARAAIDSASPKLSTTSDRKVNNG